MKRNDITVFSAKMLPTQKVVLIFSPHPDDTSIAVGGTAALLAAKGQVTSVIMTTGHRARIKGLSKTQRIRRREEEVRRESRHLGIQAQFLRLPLYENGSIQSQDMERLTQLLETAHPDIVMVPNLQDPHPTHHLCTQAVLKALRQYVQIHQVTIDVWYYESPWSLFNRDDYNAMVSIPKTVFRRKLAAIRAHKSQNARTRYDVIATSLAQLRAEIIPEQQLASYGDTPPDLGDYVELFAIETVGQGARLVESFSGIRGIMSKGLTPTVAEAYGYVYGRWLKRAINFNPKVVVGMDTRPSGRPLKESLIRGLTRAHCHIFDVGIATTPMLQFEVRNRKSDGGVMITASHNEPQWNGFKFLWKDGGALGPALMQEVIDQYHALTDMTERPHVSHYVKFLLAWLGEDSVAAIRSAKLSAVLDPNGGAMVVVIDTLFKALGIRVIPMNMTAGEFSHQIEPTANALQQLTRVVRKERADIGVAWDCDGDRVEIVSSAGDILSGHRILGLLVDQVLRHHPAGQTVVINTMTSGLVRELAERHGAAVIETDVGEANVVAKMQEVSAVVGGEGGSGGGIVPPSKCRDGVMTLLKIIELKVERKLSLAELLATYPVYHTARFDLRGATMAAATLQGQLKSLYPDATLTQLGKSLKLSWADKGYLCVRESQTEPNLLRLLVDSPDPHRTEKLSADTLKHLQKLTL